MTGAPEAAGAGLEPSMTEAQGTHYRWDDIPHEQLSPTIGRRMISTDRVTVARLYMEAGSEVPQHAHEHEQIAMVVEGHMRLFIGANDEQVVDVAAGELVRVPPNVPHRAEMLETTLAMDVFCPPRQDWLAGDDSYLRAAGSR